MYNATITVADKGGIVIRAFESEDRELKGKGSYDAVRRGGKTVFRITAADSVALRTMLNSITKMLTVIEKMRHV